MACLQVSDLQNRTQTIEFSVRSTNVAQRWARSVAVANEHTSIREADRWYNFPYLAARGERELVNDIEASVFEINKLFPNLIEAKIDPLDLQGSVNAIHVHFAETEVNPFYVNEKSYDVWNRLNNSLHALESFWRSQQTLKSAGIPECNIVVTWENPTHEPLRDEDYEHFTVAKKFGTLYINYCQTGRHLYEMFLADDRVAADHHILPLRRLCADTYVWFGSTTGPQSLLRRQEAIKKWFYKNEERLTNLGFTWGDPKLGIGWVPVADIVGDYSQLAKQVAFVHELANFGKVTALKVFSKV